MVADTNLSSIAICSFYNYWRIVRSVDGYIYGLGANVIMTVCGSYSEGLCVHFAFWKLLLGAGSQFILPFTFCFIITQRTILTGAIGRNTIGQRACAGAVGITGIIGIDIFKGQRAGSTRSIDCSACIFCK